MSNLKNPKQRIEADTGNADVSQVGKIDLSSDEIRHKIAELEGEINFESERKNPLILLKSLVSSLEEVDRNFKMTEEEMAFFKKFINAKYRQAISQTSRINLESLRSESELLKKKLLEITPTFQREFFRDTELMNKILLELGEDLQNWKVFISNKNEIVITKKNLDKSFKISLEGHNRLAIENIVFIGEESKKVTIDFQYQELKDYINENIKAKKSKSFWRKN